MLTRKRPFIVALVLTLSVAEMAFADDSKAISSLQHQIRNQEHEIAMLQKRIENQADIIESMRSDVAKQLSQTRDIQQKNGQISVSRIEKIETNLEKLVKDLKNYKTHANETSDAIEKLQKGIKSLEEGRSANSEQIKDLEKALRLLTQAVSGKSDSAAVANGCYRVKPGDSLDKIAKATGVSVKAIREMNNLDSDKIFPGQELILSEDNKVKK